MTDILPFLVCLITLCAILITVKMPLLASQWRVVIVIIITFVAINLVLYTSAGLYATRAGQMDTIVVESGNGYRSHYRHTVLIARSSQGKFHRRAAHDDAEGSGLGGSDAVGIVGDRGDNRDGRSWWMEDPSNGTSSQLLLSNDTAAKKSPSKKGGSVPRRGSGDFNIDTVLRLFKGCVTETGDILMDCFNDGFQELSKMFPPLGTVFSFVSSEIQDKITILRNYRHHPTLAPHFRTAQSMVRYEMDHHLTVQTDQPSGSRTFLRLHWALQFISALVSNLNDIRRGGTFSEQAAEAYDRTLAKHHPWIMRKAVQVALYSLPDRQELLVKLHMADTPREMAKVHALITQLDSIYDITQRLYAENRLLDLP
ncbi:ceramide-1-phosphate transfer protein-like [Babylonia areolata]|uniref:ceramide-1-phosphate transfer protein-like n=1 Tax=Babylonia areolata TaxID=304850 RepID=UPI003FD11B20